MGAAIAIRLTLLGLLACSACCAAHEHENVQVGTAKSYVEVLYMHAYTTRLILCEAF